jgi:uncharacterized membrane protein YqjE
MSDPGSTEDLAGGDSPGAATGLFRSLTNLAATLVALAQTRLELLTTELQEEVQRTVGLVIWSFIALLAVMIGLILGGLAIVFVYWDTHRVLAAVLVAAVFFVIAAIAILVLLAKVNGRPRFLDATLTELSRDSDSLKTRVGGQK